jgi:glutamyl-tRNA synthetase
MGEGNKKLSKRDPESNLFHHRDRGFIPEGLLNYLALLGWSIGPDRDVFGLDEMVQVFDIGSVNPNPARFDVKKAEAINGDHIRLLDPEDFFERCVSHLEKAGVVSQPITVEERAKLHAIAPHVHERIALLGELPLMVGFLFTSDAQLEIAPEARKTLGESAGAVLDAASQALQELPEWTTQALEETLRRVVVEGMELSPRHAFGPLRVAVSGQRVSPPLFESMEVLGREHTLARLHSLRAGL